MAAPLIVDALATGSADQTVRLWDVADARHPRMMATIEGVEGFVNSADISSDGLDNDCDGAIDEPHLPDDFGRPDAGDRTTRSKRVSDSRTARTSPADCAGA